jgi:hypothetical protein
MPTGLPWRVDAGYVCMQQAPNYGTNYTLGGKIPESRT